MLATKDIDTTLSIEEAKEDFPKAARIADVYGQATISKGNKPKYLLIDIDQNLQLEMAQEEKMEYLGRKIKGSADSAFRRAFCLIYFIL